MVTTILIWSDVLRSDDARTFRPVVVLWGVLIISAPIPSVIYTLQSFRPFVDVSQVSLCPTDPSKGCTFEAWGFHCSGQFSTEQI